MADIIAARVNTQEDAERIFRSLADAGFARDEYSSFYVNPAGQHAMQALGGDAHHSEGTTEAGPKGIAGAVIGGTAGVAVGAAAAAAVAPGFLPAAAVGGAGVGAYVGSLAGSLSGSRAGDPDRASIEEPVGYPAGLMVEIRVDREATADHALRVLRDNGIPEVQRVTGEWREGSWIDFDPRHTPEFIPLSQS
jgi:hypothetical protein